MMREQYVYWIQIRITWLINEIEYDGVLVLLNLLGGGHDGLTVTLVINCLCRDASTAWPFHESMVED